MQEAFKDLIAGLQFLTRVHVCDETGWTQARFAGSVKYFPVVGAFIGLFLAGTGWFGRAVLPFHFGAALVVAADVIFTGGLHYDGFMDTADGLFSGRSRQQMLSIMKDSRIGANGAVAVVLLLLTKWSLLLDISPRHMFGALLAMAVTGRLAMVMVITLFTYARHEGIGGLFRQLQPARTRYIALLLAIAIMMPLGLRIMACAALGICAAMLFAMYAAKLLGGLTGDVYGAIAEITELVVLLSAVILPIF